MGLVADTVDDVLDGRVEKLHDQHNETRAEQERAFDGRASEPDAGRQ